MAKNKDPNLITYPDGTVSDPNTEIKTFSLSDIGVTTDTLKKDVVPKVMSLIVDASIEGVRKELGISRKSQLKENTKAYKASIFLKEFGWSLITMGTAIVLISIGIRLFMRWVGL